MIRKLRLREDGRYVYADTIYVGKGIQLQQSAPCTQTLPKSALRDRERGWSPGGGV